MFKFNKRMYDGTNGNGYQPSGGTYNQESKLPQYEKRQVTMPECKQCRVIV